jgi:hypothetical protein
MEENRLASTARVGTKRVPNNRENAREDLKILF